jgi:hypothetical protein
MSMERHEVRVACDAMRAEARIWHDAGGTFAEINSSIRSMVAVPERSMLFFGLVMIPYAQILDAARRHTHYGAAELDAVGTALKNAADTYDSEDLEQRRLADGLRGR